MTTSPALYRLGLTVIAALLIATSSALAAKILKQEPAMGAMKEGEVVLVDDGSCPKGQIMRVVGGNHVKAGGKDQIVRLRGCVAR